MPFTAELHTAEEVFQEHWGHSNFRPTQAEVIQAALDGDDVLAVLPTSYGKSACFQVPALMREGTALVISPLIALMKDQADDCAKRNIPASYVNSHVSEDEQAERLEGFAESKYKVFYVAPERIRSRAFLDALGWADVSFLVVDEAHCHLPNTMIETPGGKVPIETLRPGDLVLSVVDGVIRPCIVEDAARKKIGRRKLLKIVTPTCTLCLTDDHPIYVVEKGYVDAKEVQEGDEVLLLQRGTSESTPARTREILQQDLLRASNATKFTERERRQLSDMRQAIQTVTPGTGGSELLQPFVLFGGIPKTRAKAVGVSCVQRGVYPDILSTKDLFPRMRASGDGSRSGENYARGKQPDEVSRGSQEGFQDPTQNKAQTSDSGREWKATARTAKEGAVAVARRGPRISDTHRVARVRQAAHHVQSGCGNPEEANCNRGGRTFPRGNHSEGTGSQEGSRVTRCRVERIEIIEPTSDERRGGYDYRVVHSLTVREGQSYFAEGLLTHNCASRWGHDFRPMYSRINVITETLAKQNKRPPILAVTATATSDIEADIAKALGMKDEYQRFVADPIRPNLAYKIRRGSPWNNIKFMVRSWDTYNGRHIVYVGTRKGSEMVATVIKEQLNPEDVGVYHAGLSKPERETIQDSFKKGNTPIIVATCAFGMGIDVPNIRSVTHFGIPGSLEDYVQETGRAGRDGKHSTLTLLIEDDLDEDRSVGLREFFLDMTNPPYFYYEVLWEWLHENLHAGETLRLSAAKISTSIVMEGGPKISDGAINGVLSTMEAYGLVYRTYAASSSVLHVDVPVTREWYEDAERQEDELTKKAREVLKYMWEEVIAPQVQPDTRRVEFVLDRATLAEMLDTSEATLRKYLKELADEGLWEVARTYSGKTTRIRKYGADLDEHAPKAEIEQKRDREQRRLAHMIGYAATDDRLEYIRDYFMKGL